MAKVALSDIIAAAGKEENLEVKVAILRKYDCPALREILRYTFDPRIQWILPPGSPPFKHTEEVGAEGRLYAEIRKLYLFVQGGNSNLSPIRREQLFITMLETVYPGDADLLLKMKDKNLPGLTTEIVNTAYPDMAIPQYPVSSLENATLNLKDGDRVYRAQPLEPVVENDDLVVSNAPQGTRTVPGHGSIPEINVLNRHQKAGLTRKGKKLSEEVKEKMRQGRRQQIARDKINKITSGQPVNPEIVVKSLVDRN